MNNSLTPIKRKIKGQMKAIKLTVGFREWDKLGDFMEGVNAMDEAVGSEMDCTTALIAAEDAEAMEYITAQLPKWFTDYETITIK